MKALILAAGIGSRLAPFTDKKPKALIEVNGVPILKNQLECLIKNNIKNIVVIAGYLHEEITRFIERYYPFVQVIVKIFLIFGLIY